MVGSGLLGDCARVCQPGGLTREERRVLLAKMPDKRTLTVALLPCEVKQVKAREAKELLICNFTDEERYAKEHPESDPRKADPFEKLLDENLEMGKWRLYKRVGKWTRAKNTMDDKYPCGFDCTVQYLPRRAATEANYQHMDLKETGYHRRVEPVSRGQCLVTQCQECKNIDKPQGAMTRRLSHPKISENGKMAYVRTRDRDPGFVYRASNGEITCDYCGTVNPLDIWVQPKDENLQKPGNSDLSSDLFHTSGPSEDYYDEVLATAYKTTLDKIGEGLDRLVPRDPRTTGGNPLVAKAEYPTLQYCPMYHASFHARQWTRTDLDTKAQKYLCLVCLKKGHKKESWHYIKKPKVGYDHSAILTAIESLGEQPKIIKQIRECIRQSQSQENDCWLRSSMSWEQWLVHRVTVRSFQAIVESPSWSLISDRKLRKILDELATRGFISQYVTYGSRKEFKFHFAQRSRLTKKQIQLLRRAGLV